MESEKKHGAFLLDDGNLNAMTPFCSVIPVLSLCRGRISLPSYRDLIPIWDSARVPVMRIIALATLKAFLDAKSTHADAREPMMAWYRQVKAADWANPADVKRDIRSASILKDGRAVFNVAGNAYRIVVWINYPYRVVYIRFVGTHRMYDAIDAQTI